MSDMTSTIAAWGRELELGGSVSADDAAELESHLLQEMDVLQKQGLRPEEAFMIATRRLGHPQEIAAEFSKNDTLMSWRRPARLVLWGMVLLQVMMLAFSALLVVIRVTGYWDAIGNPWLRNLNWLSSISNCVVLGMLWFLAANPQGWAGRAIAWLEDRIQTRGGAVLLVIGSMTCDLLSTLLRMGLVAILNEDVAKDDIAFEALNVSLFWVLYLQLLAWTVPVVGMLIILVRREQPAPIAQLATE